VNLELTDDQQELRQHVRTFLAQESGWDVVRRAEPLGFDLPLWERSRRIGVPGLGLLTDTEDGLLDTAIVTEAFGWSVASSTSSPTGC
jgi:hypothetical protein